MASVLVALPQCLNAARRQQQTHKAAARCPAVRAECSKPGMFSSTAGRAAAGAALALGGSLLWCSHPEAAQAIELHGHQQHGSNSLGELAFFWPEPLVEEFWDNVRRYFFFFITVVSGGLFSLVKPLVDLLKSPLTAILGVLFIVGGGYVLYATLSAILGITG